MGFLLFGILFAGGSHDGSKGEILYGGFADHFKHAVWQLAGVPDRLACFGQDDGVSEFQAHDWVEEVEYEGNIVRVGEGFGQWQFCGCAVTGFALHILNGRLILVNVAVAHCFIAGVTIYAVEGVFTLREARIGMIRIFHPVGRLVGAFEEGHCPQVVVAAIMASVALGIGDGCGEGVLFFFTRRERSWGVASSASRLSRVCLPFTRRGIHMASQTVFAKLLDKGIFLTGRVERRKRFDSRFCFFISNSANSEMGG